jgi:small subunit ribosomal protein S15
MAVGKTKREREGRTSNVMGLDKTQKQAVTEQYRINKKDTGSSEVQVALLTARINGLTEHLKAHRHDESSRRGLLRLVGQRRSLLRYVSHTNVDRYRALIARLGLRR